MKKIFAFSFVAFALIANFAGAQEAYYKKLIRDERLEMELKESGVDRDWRFSNVAAPYAVIEGEGEIYVLMSNSGNLGATGGYFVAARTASPRDLSGQLFIPREDGKGYVTTRFEISAEEASADAKNEFNNYKQQFFSHWMNQNAPGAAYFRYQLSLANAGATTDANDMMNRQFRRNRFGRSEFDNTFDLFTGGRALSENLQLDRNLIVLPKAGDAVDIASIQGITVKEYDWKPLVASLKPEIDSLASVIPHDQHAVFFSSFQGMIELLDAADSSGTPIIHMMDERAEDARTGERYKKQLCLLTNDLARMLGPEVINNIAITGSDINLRMGTDVAVLFDCKNAAILKGYMSAKYAAFSLAKEFKKESGEIDGVAYEGVRNFDRSVCSYIASPRGGSEIVVTNSLAQLKRLVQTVKGAEPALASTGEYIYFRDRYKKGEWMESAFCMITDATLRRWCGPKWRIADSRRTRAAGVMAAVHAEHAANLINGTTDNVAIGDGNLPSIGELKLTKRGIVSLEYGTPGFLTPIIEMDLATVTKDEAAAYERFRDTYQSYWRTFFDPIAARFSLTKEKASLDITIMPLIAQSDYNDWIDITRNVKLEPGAGDPHPESFFHLVFGFDKKSKEGREAGRWLKPFGIDVDPLGWTGNHVAFYFDKNPLWSALTTAPDKSEFIEENIAQIPFGLFVDVESGMKLTIFLTAMRAFIEKSAPDMTKWDILKHNEQSYVKISMSEEGARDSGPFEEISIYYAATPSMFTLSLREDIIKNALDRAAERKAAKKEGAAAAPPVVKTEWLGESMAAKVDGSSLELLQAMSGESYQKEMQHRAWLNIPILNEWKRMFPGRDPVEVHELLFQTRLMCPAGGKYSWNNEWKTMESTIYGSPAQPKLGIGLPKVLQQIGSIGLGVTFEKEGLRARAEIEYK
ncbi:MAG: hypothetical protein ACKVS6_11205 [Planctomycetota bacterium]